MVRDVRPLTLSYKGLSTTFGMPGWYSTASDESVHAGDDLKVSGRELAKLKARAEGVLDPDAVRRVRQRLKLSQPEAGRLIGGDPKAFGRYESGELLVNRAVSNLLRLLERHPEHLQELADDVSSVA